MQFPADLANASAVLDQVTIRAMTALVVAARADNDGDSRSSP
jgi:hypothetical protein